MGRFRSNLVVRFNGSSVARQRRALRDPGKGADWPHIHRTVRMRQWKTSGQNQHPPRPGHCAGPSPIADFWWRRRWLLAQLVWLS
ncbi:hypothetical protein H920_13609 [Fukomys damarensis]|uniref:Uncharacterized protein n=1 Tax=Fukomys damarensis TaxID=885580 RepID=A0A091D432_FUKDA|nr:hypothetical protein H920_13609 [Fukomys damarensis]